MLPFALYQVCTLGARMMDVYKRRSESVEHLSAAGDLRLCIDARAELARQVTLFAETVFALRGSDGCKGSKCIMALNDILGRVELNTPGACDIFNSYDRAIEEWADVFELCGVCKSQMLEREVEERRRVWMLLPGIFGLSVKACGFTTDDGRSQP